MGAYTPAPLATPELLAEVKRTVLQPTVEGMQSAAHPTSACSMPDSCSRAGLRVLEFNCRFGDPRPRPSSAAGERLGRYAAGLRRGAAGVAPPRWRGQRRPPSWPPAGELSGQLHHGPPAPRHRADGSPAETVVFQAGTRRSEDGQLLTDGGRVLADRHRCRSAAGVDAPTQASSVSTSRGCTTAAISAAR